MQDKSTPSLVLSSTDEGIQHGDELHDEDCPCRPCKVYRDRTFRRQTVAEYDDNPTCEGWKECQGCINCPDVPMALIFRTDVEYFNEMDQHHEKVMAAMYAKWDKDALGDEHTLPISLNPGPKRPTSLERSDGETLLYAGEINSVYGEPSIGKSFLAAIGMIVNLKNGVRCCYWDFEDKPATLAERMDALNALGLADSPNVVYALPSLADDESAMLKMATWLSGGDKPGLMILDSATQAVCPIDGASPSEWYEKFVEYWFKPFGIGVIVLDHVPKQKIDRPRGPVGSYQKLSRITGAALYVSGRPWTKKEDGMIKLRNEKDRKGDLPGPLMATVGILNVNHVDGTLQYSFDSPDPEDDSVDLEAVLLEMITSKGAMGVSSKREVRKLIPGKGTSVDKALDSLVDAGLVVQTKHGQKHHYVAVEFTL